MSFLNKSIPVLMYHRLAERVAASSLVIPPEDFSRQIDWLDKKSFRLLSLDEVIQQGCRAPLWERSLALTFDDGFRDNYEQAFPLLLTRGKTAALFVVVHWVGTKGFMDWKEIRKLADSGITIGSHALTHRWLPDLKDPAELHAEIFDSKKIIEDRIGKEIRHFCYPVGGVDQRVADEVEQAGYRAAWVAGARPTCRIRQRRLSLRRVKIGPSDGQIFRFSLKARGIKGLFSD